ncbi:MAG: hypothetical protein Q9201_001335 [Fulgogasparrea decipioides]
MGQRHQLFVIAKINGRYRQLCVIHHQWLYGHTALRRCLDTLKTFQHPANRLSIQQELIAASEKDDRFWLLSEDEDEGEEKNGHVPFPFIATCLIMGASFNVNGYYHGILIEPFYMSFNGGDNNNGITIFDITDLDNVRYCFVDFEGMESKREVELMTPLSAQTYLEAYYELDESDDKAGLIPLVESFQGRSLVSVGALKSTWPHGEWQGDDPFMEEETSRTADTAESTGDDIIAVAGDSSEGGETKRPGGIPSTGVKKSLRDHSMDILLDNLIDQSEKDSSDVSDLIAEAEVLSDFIPKLRLKLYGRAATLVPTASVLRLLYKALEQDTEVSLSPFTTLTVEHLSELVVKLCHGNMRVLNLSNMPNLSDSDLKTVLHIDHELPSTASNSAAGINASGNLSTIILLESPKVSMIFLTDHLGRYDVHHSELMRHPLVEQYGRFDQDPLAALHFSAPNIVSQLVWVGITMDRSCDSRLRLGNGQFDWKDLKYSTGAFDRFNPDNDPKYKNFLLDVPMPAGKTIHGLRRLMQYLTFPKLGWGYEEWPKAAARCFATTSTLGDGDSYGVGPLSAAFYLDGRDRVESGKGQLVTPNQWAIVLVHEAFDAKDQDELEKHALENVGEPGAEGTKDTPGNGTQGPSFKPQKRLRYALAKALPESDRSKERFLVTDVPGYLKHVLGGEQGDESEATRMMNWWKKEVSAFEQSGHGYYEDADIHEILRKVYSGKPADDIPEAKRRGIDPFADIMKMMSIAQQHG